MWVAQCRLECLELRVQDLLVWGLEFRHAALRLRSWSLRFAALDFGVYDVRLSAKGS